MSVEIEHKDPIDLNEWLRSLPKDAVLTVETKENGDLYLKHLRASLVGRQLAPYAYYLLETNNE